MRHIRKSCAGLFLTACASFGASSVYAETYKDPIANLIGSWDLPGTRVNIEIRRNRVVQHWALGTGDIENETATFFRISYRHRALICRYEIKRYGKDELAFSILSQPSPADCDLGILRRAPDDHVKEQDDFAEAEKLRLKVAADEKAARQKLADQKAAELQAAEQRAAELKAEQAKAEQAKADQAKADQAKAEQEKADQVKADQAKAEQIKADQAKADQAKADQSKDEKLVEPKGSDKQQPQNASSDTSAKRLDLTVGTKFRDCDTCPEMTVAPAGNFLMGSPDYEVGRNTDEGPQRRVIFRRPFAVGRYAITVDEFKAFADDTGHRTGDVCGAGVAERDNKSIGSFEAPPGFAAGFVQSGRHPVVCVSWDDAKAFTAWMSAKTKQKYRLLTEAEREYVTRAGTTTAYWWGAGVTPQQALYNRQPRQAPAEVAKPAPVAETVKPLTAEKRPTAGSNSTPAPKFEIIYPTKPAAPAAAKPGSAAPATVVIGRTAAVDQYQPNDWGLYQVHGNVAEWTEDCWTPSIASGSSSGAAVITANCARRVLRGGAWSFFPQALRAAHRDYALAEDRYNHIGFRIARDIDP